MRIEQWDFDNQTSKDFSVDEEKVRVFIQWLLSNNTWKDETDYLIDRAYKLRKELVETMVPDLDPLRRTNVKQNADGKFARRNPVKEPALG